MSNKIIPGEILIRELQKSCHVSESLIRVITQREPHLNRDSHLFEILCNEINMLVEFMYSHYNSQIYDKLSSKVHIVRDNLELLHMYLVEWQRVTFRKYKDVKFENQIDVLFNQ